MSLLEKGKEQPLSEQVQAINSVRYPVEDTKKFETTLQVPQNFPAILKDFSREVLRNQPESIYAFAAEYFKNLAEQSVK